MTVCAGSGWILESRVDIFHTNMDSSYTSFLVLAFNSLLLLRLIHVSQV